MASIRLLPLILAFLLGIISCSTEVEKVKNPSSLEIFELNPNKWTALMKQNMLHLAQVYDLEPFLYTRNIQITSDKIISHSHPVLTLNTRYVEQPHKILSVWLHEEFHWWAVTNQKQVDLAIRDLKAIYPKVPIEGQTSSEHSTYLHLIVCYLEYVALKFYLGEKETNRIIGEFINKDKIYPWIYSQIMNKNFAIKQVVEKHLLLPPPLT